MFCPPIYLHSQSGGQYPGILPDGINLNFKLLPACMQKRAKSIPGGLEIREVLKTEGEASRLCLASWYHFSNSTNSRTKISLNLNKSGEYSGILPSGGLKKC